MKHNHSNGMSLSELIEMLQDIEADHSGEDIQVRFASQPKWPMEYTIKATEAVLTGEQRDCSCDGEGCKQCHGTGYIREDEDGVVVYLVEGHQIGYLPDNAREQIGW